MNEESIIAYLKSECSPREGEALEHWVSRSRENRKRFEDVKMIWEHSHADYTGLPVDPAASWSRIRSAISEESPQIKPLRKPGTGKYWRIAASVALLIGLGYLALRFSGRESATVEQAFVQTQAGRAQVELPDGSSVWLNANSSLSYPAAFGRKERRVRLQGEAYFEVDRERRRPFTVEIGNSRVRVLGTSFNIRFPGGEMEQVVTLATGKVSFHPMGNPSEGVLINAGERGVCSADGRSYTKSVNTDRNFLAWKTGILVFQGTPLEEVCRVLSAHYRKDIRLLESVDPNRQLTVTWNNKEVEEVMEVLTMTLDLSFRTDGNKIIIF